jgi:hypothetical protein
MPSSSPSSRPLPPPSRAAGHRALDILTMDRIVGGPRTIRDGI